MLWFVCIYLYNSRLKPTIYTSLYNLVLFVDIIGNTPIEHRFFGRTYSQYNTADRLTVLFIFNTGTSFQNFERNGETGTFNFD